MPPQHATRGHHLAVADRRFLTGGSWFARLLAPGFRGALDRIDRGLVWGSVDLSLPDGARRTLGGRGQGPRAEVTLRSWNALVRLAVSGSVGWYRAWAEGEWDSPDPVILFDLFMRNRATLGNAGRARGLGKWINRAAHWARRNSRSGSRRNIRFHYDLGSDFYSTWLDTTMSYSSALFAEPISADEPLEEAQRRKIRTLLDQLDLRSGDRLLEIGCGWGGLALTAYEEYGAAVTGITLSEDQKAYAQRRLGGAAEILLCDYRDVRGQFDAVASVEMVEAVGEDYWPDYMRVIARSLRPGGQAAIQFISIDDAIFEHYARNADFIQTYIFPGGLLISESRFRRAAEDAGLVWKDRRSFGLHYAETLRRWRARFDAAVAEHRLPAGFADAFIRLWRFYLMYCEGGFRGGGIDVVQVTLVKE
jgi:cyclopropane-fatty-acyl-phospholipid synthase